MRIASYYIFAMVLLMGCSKYHCDEKAEYGDFSIETRSSASVLIDSLESSLVVLPNGLTVLREGDYYRSDDMVFKYDYVNAIRGTGDRGLTGLSSIDSYWPNRTVYYAFDPSVNSSHRQIYLDIMQELSDSSGVVFRPRTSSTTNYILFRQVLSGSSASAVGMQGGEQPITIVIPFSNPTLIHHEIFHALGFYHEHQRSDRDSFVYVNYDNIKDDYKHNFDTLSGVKIGPYDISSIMQYGSFSDNPNAVYNTSVAMMTAIDGSFLPSVHLNLSSGDVQALRAIYGPPFHRLENVTTVYQDGVAGSQEIYDAYTETYLRFYDDVTCTKRTELTFPREIRIRSFQVSCSPESNGIVTSTESFQTITVPAGVDSFLIDARRNLEYYYNSHAISINAIYYSLSKPNHLPDVELFN